ncbi:cx9C motif-containing protein 4 isoform X2 [Ctenocephalides felis]|uniref:cx9C motif-containing protein 4 isoform X2 n=1 Tax=Ctenocephalides felis TaxID=7515 RepID=UPI000E6E4B59|nr:cx9C motif-containing protein 4 isoform X2 [Ctenocephalides felis]
MRSKDPCKANACMIQKCLSENNFQESACTDVIELMRLCCVKWGTKSFVCNGIKTEKETSSTSSTVENNKIPYKLDHKS